MILKLKNNHLNTSGAFISDINKIKLMRDGGLYKLVIYDGTGSNKNDQLIVGYLTQEEADEMRSALKALIK